MEIIIVVLLISVVVLFFTVFGYKNLSERYKILLDYYRSQYNEERENSQTLVRELWDVYTIITKSDSVEEITAKIIERKMYEGGG